MAGELDRFRNPVGHAMRNSMATLVEEVLGDMDADKIAPALDAIVRLRAVQDLTPSAAVGFVFLLRPVVRGSNPSRPAMVEAHIDQLALMAFDRYLRCREQIAEIGANEARRRVRVRPALSHK